MRLAWVVLVAGCGGMAENEFMPAYVEAFCEHVLTCSDEAELTFDGILTVEDCVLQREAEIARWGVGCKYRPLEAAACLDGMAALQCPAAEGTLADRPAACLPVYTECLSAQ